MVAHSGGRAGREDLVEPLQVFVAQLALAWVLAQGDDIVPIPGTKRRKYLEENAGAADLKLSAADLSRIDRALPPGAAAGSRYDAMGMALTDR